MNNSKNNEFPIKTGLKEVMEDEDSKRQNDKNIVFNDEEEIENNS
jgi:hypothetical protein